MRLMHVPMITKAERPQVLIEFTTVPMRRVRGVVQMDEHSFRGVLAASEASAGVCLEVTRFPLFPLR
jgi:hypothetical protein